MTSSPSIQARRSTERGMTMLIFPTELEHALRVALQPIMAGEPTATATEAIRKQADQALAQLELGRR